MSVQIEGGKSVATMVAVVTVGVALAALSLAQAQPTPPAKTPAAPATMSPVTPAAKAPVASLPTDKPAAAPAKTEYTPEVGQAGKDVIWVPTAQVLVNRLLDMAKLTPDDILYDLGSGDGRTVITAAKRGVRAYGIEFNPDLVALSKRNAANEGVAERATFEKADIFQTNFSNATVVTLFLLPSLNVKLRPTILNMKPGTRIAANSFDMGDWKPDQTARVGGDCQSWCTAYLWIVPVKAEGNWKFGAGELVLKQQYQMLTGTLSAGDSTLAISDGKLDGERISFTVGGAKYNGVVKGDLMEGRSIAGTSKTPWFATRGN